MKEVLRSRIESVLSQGWDQMINAKIVEDLVQEVLNEELKSIREELKLSQDRFKEFYDNVPVGLVGYFEDFRIHIANKTFCSNLGLEHPVGLLVHSFVRPDSQEDFFLHVDKVLRTRLPQISYLWVTANGVSRFISVESNVLTLDGRPLIRSAVSDHTREYELAQELSLGEKKLRTYLDNIPQPVVITDARGAIQDVNSALLDMYGYRREEVLGQNPRVLNPGKEVYRDLGFSEQEYSNLFSSLWKDSTDPAKGFWDGTIVNRRADGSLVWVKLLVKTVFDGAGNLKYMIALPLDISNSRSVEQKNRVELYRTLASLSELRDEETGNHMRRVGILSRRLAKSLGMPEKFCQDIELFAPMHDIGKVGIPDSILLAPRKLNQEEFEEMKRHTLLGHALLEGKEEMAMAADITLSHHERWDGSGYPHGLSGDSIPLSARITAVVDFYDALRSRRPYKEPWEHREAIREVVSGSGSIFDPSLVETFLYLEKTFESVHRELPD